MLPHSPNGPECVWINPTSMSVGFCQAEEEETLYQDPGTAKPPPQRVYERHRGLRGPRGFQAHPTSSTSQGRGARPQGQCLGPGTAAILMGTEVSGREKASKVGQNRGLSEPSQGWLGRWAVALVGRGGACQAPNGALKLPLQEPTTVHGPLAPKS